MTGSVRIFRRADELVTMQGAAQKDGRHVIEEDLSIIPKGTMVVRGGKIAWIGPDRALPREWAKARASEIDLKGQTVLPGFIECHTHLVFAGDRAEEFEWRLRGTSYSEISARGGGILSTVKQTRAASQAKLLALAQERSDRFLKQGVTTLEVKSGYGLNLKDEMKCLEVAAKLKGPKTVSTFLGAHALAPEFKSYEEYLRHLGREVLPKLKKRGLARRVDIFIEKGFFPVEAAREYLRTARDLGFEVTIHADQLSLSGGTSLAIELGGRSADHVIQIGDSEIAKMAASSVTAVLLPAADLYMRCPYPPARKLIDAGARVALATDFNPGTSPTQDLNLTGLLARLMMGMTLPEVFGAYTVGAASALGCAGDRGSLGLDKRADFVSTPESWRMFFFEAGKVIVKEVFVGGVKRASVRD